MFTYFSKKTIKIGSEFILVNLKTKEKKRYLIHKSWTKYTPTHVLDMFGNHIARVENMSDAGEKTPSGATIISDKSPVAKACLDKRKNDTVCVVINKNKLFYTIEEIFN